MRRWKYAGLAFIVMILVNWISGCGAGEDGEALLKRTLAAVHQHKDLAYESSSKVHLASTAKQQAANDARQETAETEVNFNPLEALQKLEEMPHTTIVEPAAGKQQEKILRVAVDQEEWTAFARKLWEARIGGMRQENEQLVQQSRVSLPEAKAKEVQQELSQSLEQANRRMVKLLDGMKASGTYRIWTDPETHLPTKLVIENTMTYSEDNSVKNETIVDSFQFK